VVITTMSMVATMLVGVTIAVTSSSPPTSGPVQHVWGNPALQRHRVPASVTIAGAAKLARRPAVRVGTPLIFGSRPKGKHPAAGAVYANEADRAIVLPPSRRPRHAVSPVRPLPKIKTITRGPRADVIRPLLRPSAPRVAGFVPRLSRLLPSLSAADKLVYANPSGTRTAMLFQDPVNYRLPGGRWDRINLTLVPRSGSGSQSALSSPAPPVGGWREAAAAEPVVFAGYADAARLVWLPLAGSSGVGFGVAGAAHTAGVAAQNVVTYQGVRQDSGVRFSAEARAVTEQLVLNSARAPSTWVFPLRLAGVTADIGPGGLIEFTDRSGKVLAYVQHGIMTDSRINPRSGDGAMSHGVSYRLADVSGRPVIVMRLDRAWLRSPRRVYPVIVDPSVTSLNSTGTTFAETDVSGDNSASNEIRAGTFDGGTNVAESFMKFDLSSLSNDTVLGAELGLFNSWSFSCHHRPLYVYPVTSSWTPSGITSYSGRPSIGAAIGRKSFATGWVPLGSTVSPCPSKWEQIKLDQGGTNLIDGWTQGTQTNNGLALGASSTDSYGWKKFTSMHNSSGDPFLTVTYTPYGASYTLAKKHVIDQITPEQSGKIAITVTNEGNTTWDANNGNGYELSYEAYDHKGNLVANHPVFTALPSNVAPHQSVTVDATVNALSAGYYAIDFDMFTNTKTTPLSFLSQGIASFPVGLQVIQPPTQITGVYPPSGFIAPTNSPQLSVTASTGGSPSYNFSITCQPLPGTICSASSFGSGSITENHWTPPELTWDEPYTWQVTVTSGTSSQTTSGMIVTPEVPQPAVTSRIGATSGRAFDPLAGNYAAAATDASVPAAGPPLQVLRTYNSLDPVVGRSFGIGWASVLDMALAPDNPGSSTSDMVVTMSDGS